MMRSRSNVKPTPGLLLQPYVLAQLAGALIEQIVEGTDLTASDYAVTSWLGARAGATPSELAADLGLAATTVSAMIERLVRKQHVRRTDHPEDGRSYVLALTARGRTTNARLARRFGATIGTLRHNLDGDEAEILDALRRLEAALRQTLDDLA
jgi:DNA-binding MarR family transcriptional regulator